MGKKREKRDGLLTVIAEMWKSRNIPVKFEKRGAYAVITGPKDFLLPKAEIPAEVCGIPVIKVDSRAFVQCNFLEEVTIADGVEILDTNAFSNCENLMQVHMGDSIRSIGRNCFFECKNMFCVDLSATLREIGNRAFYGCVGLRDIKLPDGIETIGEQAFYGCNKLKSINIPLALKELPRSAFEGCTELERIYLEKGSPADKILSKSEYYAQMLCYIPRF
jgi:hypothetical protein